MKTRLVTLVLGTLATTAALGAEPEIVCYETDPANGRGAYRVEVGEDGGRLLATLFLEREGDDRLVATDGVVLRSAAGRELDTLYVGPTLKLSLSSETLEGFLDWRREDDSERRIAVWCE